MTEWYRKHFGKDLKQLVDEGSYKDIRNQFLLQAVAFTVAGIAIGVSLVRDGWIT